MDRQIIYPGQIPLDTDLLNTNKNVMLALGKLASASLGVSGVIHGLAVTPTSPASLNVNVASGSIYMLENVDNTSYGSLAADTTDQIVKQGILLAGTQLSCPAPGTTGQSINYLIQAAFNEVDTGSVALPYYNSSNPSQAWSGPNNTGTPQATTRANQCVVTVKAGAAATTGTQATPSPDAGNIGLAVVTVANGQATITASNIVQATGAALVPQDGCASNVAHAMYTKNVGGAANVTLTAQEAAYPILTLTGTLTGNIQVIVPAVVRQRVINNQTTGGFSVTVITPSGTGTVAPQGLAIPMFCDGTNVNSSVSALLTQAQGDARYGSSMFSISASVAANAMTVGLNPCKLDFRSSSLTSGTPSNLSLSSALSLTIPSGATLGAINATLARFMLLAINNAGTIELAVVNQSGGVDLSGTGLINTTAISAAATSAATIYSANARTGVPYQVVGYIENTQATAGTYVTAPSLVQGATATTLGMLQNSGYGQTWQDVTASRAFGTTYYNITSKEIKIVVEPAGSASSITIKASINGGAAFVIGACALPSGNAVAVGFVTVPAGQSYNITQTGGTGAVTSWIEER